MTNPTPPPDLAPLIKLTRDIRAAARTLSDDEARFLVDYYYLMQEDRIRSAHQVRTLAENEEPSEVVGWLFDNAGLLERNIKSALGVYADSKLPGRWAQSIVGIGPIIAAGLLAHIDIGQAPSVGHIWAFAGLDPTKVWAKGQKRPWNAKLKTLAWKIGESWVKVSGRENDVYGHLYVERKAYEQTRNAAGAYADQAAAKLAKFKIGKDTDAFKHYSRGVLPPAHIHARAKRWAVKLFLAHFHECLFFCQYGTLPAKPYILTPQGGHVHEVVPPNTDLVPGWTEARAKGTP